MIYIIACFASFLSGLGIGGGSSFVLLCLAFNILSINEARTYNLLLFISIGIVIFFKRFKFKQVLNLNYFKSLGIIIIGAIGGMILNHYIEEEKLKLFLYIFMLAIGIYEIISSLINIKKEKNITKKGA